MSRRPVHIGCSGWNYRDWRGAFYPQRLPQRRWLEHYATQFDAVEVNASFYRLVDRDTAARWAEQTPAGFVFAVKASRYMTHVKRLSAIERGATRFYEGLEPLREAGRLGPTLWQLPDNFARDDERLAGALRALPTGRHAFEFRHPSWFTRDVYVLLRNHGAALVIADHPERRFQSHEGTTDWRYVRFHYGQRGRRGNYSPSELRAWARRLRRWSAEHELFVYFNNDWEAFAPRDAARLRDAFRPRGGG